MCAKVLILLIASLGTLPSAGSPQTKEQAVVSTVKNTQSAKAQAAGTHASAKAKITVQSSEAKPYDQTASPPLLEVLISERFAGDIDGQSNVRALQVLRDDKSAHLVSMQRFRGKLGGREGTFVLQGSEIVENSKIKATWFVVPGSGTGDLSGLRGEGGFAGSFGKGSDGWLNYWIER
jgi:hypothetical protein